MPFYIVLQVVLLLTSVDLRNQSQFSFCSVSNNIFLNKVIKVKLSFFQEIVKSVEAEKSVVSLESDKEKQ